jgi:hypothetical protein
MVPFPFILTNFRSALAHVDHFSAAKLQGREEARHVEESQGELRFMEIDVMRSSRGWKE